MEVKEGTATAEGIALLRTEVEKLKEELKTSGEGQYPCAHAHWCFYTCVGIVFYILTQGKFI